MSQEAIHSGDGPPDYYVPHSSALPIVGSTALFITAFGAGFGGSVWAIVADLGTKEFLAEWKQSYLHAFPQYADQVHFFTTLPPHSIAIRG